MEQKGFDGCFGCGPSSEYGLRATFRNMENGDVEGVCTFQEQHCGYQDTVHVGAVAGFLSEVLGRLSFQRDMYYLTQSLKVTFRCAISPGVKVRAFATLKRETAKHFTAEAKMFGPDGTLVALGEGRFLLMEAATTKRILRP
ncbi:MAG: PaaI family thioesterase [bacterium]|nr:MAG: PaaI family thioesterase [bacterium]